MNEPMSTDMSCPKNDELPYRSPRRIHDRRFFYKYVSSHVAKIILATRKLRWSSPLLFNDPFDVTQELRLNFNEADLHAAVAAEWANLLETGESSYAPSSPWPRAMAAMMAALRDQPDLRSRIAASMRRDPGSMTAGQFETFAELRQVWRKLVPDLRVLCLSELNDVTSMWLHYADKYRGAVLQFETFDRLDSVFLAARPVIYQDSPPAIASKEAWARCLLEIGPLTYQDLITEYQYVKTTDWAYEREWRLVTLGAGTELFEDYGFCSRELAGVYLGTHCSQDDEKEIVGLLSHGLEHVSAYKAFIAGPDAKFTFQPIRVMNG
jgi:hypothetical protein